MPRCTDHPILKLPALLTSSSRYILLFFPNPILASMAVFDRIITSSGSTGTVGLYLTNLTILLMLSLLGYCSASAYTTYRRLRHVPGPRIAGFSKWWMLRNTLGGSMHLALKEVCETYGKRR